MQAYIVGADNLGNIPQLLAEYDIQIAHHVSGRNPSHQRKPDGIKGSDLLILFTDFLGHNVMQTYREAAQKQQIRFLACRRSTSVLAQSLDKIGAQRRTRKAA